MTSRIELRLLDSALVLALAVAAAAGSSAHAEGYDDLVALFGEWRSFQRPVEIDGVPDYTAAAMAAQHRALDAYRERLVGIDPQSWPVEQQVDYYLVWAEMNGLDFDHRVLEPWARDPAFYAMLIESESDTPSKEGPVIDGAIELWRLEFPLQEDSRRELARRLGSIPRLLAQARGNLVGEGRDLWRFGIRTQEEQEALLAGLAEQLSLDHPEIVESAESARRAVVAFRDWLTEQLPSKQGPSGIGKENYDWYLRNVHLVPYTWEQELRSMERELARSVAHLALEEHRNRSLPPLEPPESAAAWNQRVERATVEFLRFLDQEDVLVVEDYMEPALRERLQPWTPPERRHFFAQVDLRDPRVLLCHFIHWIEKARMHRHPHPSPIRRHPALYNIWDSRSEGLATGMEEMMMSAGMFADSPRSRELVYIMIAMRAARAIAGLRVQSNDWSVEEAIAFATSATPRGWFRADGELVRFEQQLYLRQPGYGTSYLTGKALLEALLAARAEAQTIFELESFMTELFDAGMIPVSLVRWELTGRRDHLPPLQ